MSKTRYIKEFYPEAKDADFLTKIYKKREFYYNRVPQRKKMESYDEIKRYRSLNCPKGEIEPREQQTILPNFISPNTPYKGVLLMHGVGSGKTWSAIRIAEQFKEQVKKYNTKIFVVVPGTNTKENFKNELIDNTGETYLKNRGNFEQMNKAEIEYERKMAINNALQYYKILSYKTFHRKVLGEKIVEKKIVGDNKIKSTYRKDVEGNIEREVVIDKITNMDNSILIIDEAHNISGNEYGEALREIVKKSENLRVILLTATPMINYADEIIDLLNYIRPLNDQLERDKIFTSDRDYNMKIKENGLDYLKAKIKGYVSFYRGSIPYTFADRNELGEIPEGLLFTPVIQCKMERFQYDTYLKTLQNFNDNLDKGTPASYNFASPSNFAFPCLNNNKTELLGCYSNSGITTILAQLNTDGSKIRSLINQTIFNNKLSKDEENNFIMESNKKSITGLVLKLPYLKYFSIKFYTAIYNLNQLVEGKKGSSTAFIYSNLVKAGGIELFAEALIQNGYLEYQEDGKYDIKDDTLDYRYGLTFAEFVKKKNKSEFKPATFILVTGGTEDGDEEIPEVKQKIIKNIFNNPNNSTGRDIKFVLGSRVMNEGVTLKNCKEVHILDAFFNIPKAEQVIGRAIRMCVHMDTINDNNKYPVVNVYRYVVSLNKGLSTDELLYQKAELKYLTVKEIEHALKEAALDCPLLLHANTFPEEMDNYKGCVYPTLDNVKAGKKICPALCDFRECEFKCDGNKLNENYWDYKIKSYRNLDKKEIDYSTFNDDFAKYEIILIKNRIKDLYRFKHVYVYSELLEEIKKAFLKHQAELFEEYFLGQALEDLMPKTENDFNNFTDTVYDKFNRAGYLIQRDKYYIFQPFNQNEDVPMFYRKNLEINQSNQVSFNNYVKQNYNKYLEKEDIIEEEEDIEKYTFDDTYFSKRDEYSIVGIIDKNLNKLASSERDLFKMRSPRPKEMKKKRETGLSTVLGAVCSYAKDKQELIKLYNKIQGDNKDISNLTKDEICNEIRNKLLYLEKYSTGDNKKTYMMIPNNHPVYPFPYNLEDRVKYHISNIIKLTGMNIKDILVKKQKDKEIKYNVTFEDSKNLKSYYEDFKKWGFELKNNIWSKLLE